jgi:translocation and assembly module TamA
MKKMLWSLCLMGVAAPVSAAFFQQKADEQSEAKTESPVKVNVQGADDARADNVRALLPSLRALKCDSPAERVARFIESSDDKLQEAAEAMGYYDARFNVTPVRQAQCLALNVAVAPGEPVRVTDVKVQITGDGKDLSVFRELTAAPPYRVGDVLVLRQYEDFKTSLGRAATSNGFFDAEYITRTIEVDPDTLQAQVHIHFGTGKRYRVGKVAVKQDVLDDKHLQRFVRVRQGDVYEADAIRKQQQLLEGASYYSEVLVSSDFEQAVNGEVPVNIEAKRRKRYSYTGKVGYATDTGAHLETGMDIHWVNAKGHKLNARGSVGQDQQSAEVTYKVPLWNPEHEYTSLGVGWKQSDNGDIESRATKVGVDYNRRNKSDWQQTVFINYLDEITQVNGEAATKAQLTLIGARVKKTKVDDTPFAGNGWTLGAELQGAQQGVLSDQSVLQAKLHGKRLQTLSNNGKVIVQANLGTTLTDDLNEMPKSLRFFAGGVNSVRGYDFESLGEKNAESEVIGGKHLLTGSLEYEHPLVDKWSAAAFVDAGNAFDDSRNLTMKVGAGFGVRWKSPLGKLRADLAVPKDDTRDMHFYFGLGPDL